MYFPTQRISQFIWNLTFVLGGPERYELALEEPPVRFHVDWVQKLGSWTRSRGSPRWSATQLASMWLPCSSLYETRQILRELAKGSPCGLLLGTCLVSPAELVSTTCKKYRSSPTYQVHQDVSRIQGVQQNSAQNQVASVILFRVLFLNITFLLCRETKRDPLPFSPFTSLVWVPKTATPTPPMRLLHAFQESFPTHGGTREG